MILRIIALALLLFNVKAFNSYIQVPAMRRFAGTDSTSQLSPWKRFHAIASPSSPLSRRSQANSALFGSVAKEGIFSPLVKTAKGVMGEDALKQLRADVIVKHSKVIAAFVDTSDSKFGRIALKTLFEAADTDGDGVLTSQEIRDACKALGFDWIDDSKAESLVKRADVDENDVIDFEEFVKSTPTMLRTNLVRLAKQNGNDLGFLV